MANPNPIPPSPFKNREFWVDPFEPYPYEPRKEGPPPAAEVGTPAPDAPSTAPAERPNREEVRIPSYAFPV